MANQNKGKTALVTGASGGIGLEFSRLLAKEGYDLILVARSQSALEEQAAQYRQQGVQVTVFTNDLAQPGAAQTLADQVQQAGLKVDVLINNAGFATYGHFVELPVKGEVEMMQINVITLTELTRLLLPQMIERHSGQILNLASTASFQPGPLMAVYYATKAYVLSFSEALANELEGTGVTVTALAPGPTQSGFQQRAAMEDSKLVSGRKILDATTVARVGYEAMQKGKTLVIPGLRNAIMAQAYRFTPRKLSTQVVRRMQERTGH